MKNEKIFEYEDDDFKSYKTNNIGVIKIKNNVFEIITDLSESNEFFQRITLADNDMDIDALLILNENGCLSNKEYTQYIDRVYSLDDKDNSESKIPVDLIRTRQIVVSNRYIRKVIQHNKIIVSALCGEVVTPFIGAFLAADLRFASENMVFSLSHYKFDLHPSTALPYFLSKYVGHAKASQILFECNNITAKKALDLGIVNEILPDYNFEELCVNKVSQVMEKSLKTLNCTKKLLNYSLKDFEEYMEFEEQRFIRR